jgi:hypothetical protein
MALLPLGVGGMGFKLKWKIFPHVHFIHYNGYQFNLVMKQACSSVKSVKGFFFSMYQDFAPSFHFV